jgi:leader peptidase (prepilin peptidase)/N-methyltransferase
VEAVHSFGPGVWASVLVLATGLAALSWIDFRTGYLPDWLQVLLAIAGLIVVGAGSPVGITPVAAVIGAVMNGAVFWSIGWIVSRVKGRPALGFGDVKLVAVGGIWVGPWALPWIMAIGGVITLAGAILASGILRKAIWRGEMPLGPGLAAGIFAAYIAALMHLPWLRLSEP